MKLGIFGVAGHNRGDDAIALSLVTGFSGIRQGIDFSVATLRPGVFLNIPRVKPIVVNRRSPAGLLRLAYSISTLDAVVLGGGSVLQDQLGGGRLRGMLGYVWTVSVLARLLNKPIVTAPIGIDELTRRGSNRVAREVLSRTELIGVRDPRSAEIAQALVGQARIETYCDPVFGWPTEPAPSRQNRVVLSPAYEGYNEDCISNVFAAVIERLAMQWDDALFTIIAMDERVEEDAGKIQLIVDRLPSRLKEKTTLSLPEDPRIAADLIRSSRAVVAMRLHSLILGFGYTDLFCLSRTTKTDSLIQTYRVPGAQIFSGLAPEQIARLVSESLSGPSLIGMHRTALRQLMKTLDLYYRDAIAVLDSAIARS